MNKNSETFVLGRRLLQSDGSVTLDAERVHSVRNRIVQAAIQRAKFIDGEGRVAFNRKVGDGLARSP
jgi:hypothetical protein